MMSVFRTFGLAIAACGLLAQPAVAREKQQMDVVKQCPGDMILSTSGACVAPPAAKQSAKPKNALPSQASTKKQLPIPILELPSFDRTTENYQLASGIIAISFPRDAFIDLVKREFPTTFYNAFMTDPNFQEIEKEYPGYTRFLANSMTDFMVALIEPNYPYFADSHARQYAESFTLKESRELDALYRSDLGKKIWVFGYDSLSIDGEKMAKSIETDGDALGDQSVTISRKESMAFAQSLSPEELDQVVTLIKTPLFKKLQRVNAVSNQKSMEAGAKKLLEDSNFETYLIDISYEYFENYDSRQK